MTNEQRPDPAGGILIGVTIMMIGVTLMLDRAGVIAGFHYSVFWGGLVTAIGIVKLSRRRAGAPLEGGWWVFFGAWMLLNETRVWRFHDSWPLFLVAIGISMVWKELFRRRGVA